MKLDAFPFIIISLLTFLSCDKDPEDKFTGCTDSYATNYDSTAILDCDCCEYIQRHVVFWTDDDYVVWMCGTITLVKIVNNATGDEITTGLEYSETPPLYCDSTQIGHILLNEGSYKVTYVGTECDTSDVTFFVTGGCNMIKVGY
jgi:hypothetical protein